MKLKSCLATLTLVLILLAACSAPNQILQAGQIVLKPGESIASEDNLIKVTFVGVTEDSRCPTGVQCVWAGQVMVLVEVTLGTEVQQYTLVTVTTFEGDVNSIEVGDYTVTLTQVDPYPVYGQATNPADYQVTLKIN